MVVVQHPAEARATGNCAVRYVVIRRWSLLPDELATNALVEPLGHVVLDKFFDQEAQMSLTENHEVIETLVLYGLHKSLRVRIAIRALCRDLHAHSGHRERSVRSIVNGSGRSEATLVFVC